MYFLAFSVRFSLLICIKQHFNRPESNRYLFKKWWLTRPSSLWEQCFLWQFSSIKWFEHFWTYFRVLKKLLCTVWLARFIKHLLWHKKFKGSHASMNVRSLVSTFSLHFLLLQEFYLNSILCLLLCSFALFVQWTCAWEQATESELHWCIFSVKPLPSSLPIAWVIHVPISLLLLLAVSHGRLMCVSDPFSASMRCKGHIGKSKDKKKTFG